MNAFIFITTQRGIHWNVLEEVLKIADVKIGHAVTGHHDIIAYTDFAKIADLTRIVDKIQTIHGVARTTTSIAMAPRLDDSPSRESTPETA